MNQIEFGQLVKIRNGYAFESSDFQDKGVVVIRMSDFDDLVVNVRDAAKVPYERWDQLPSFRIEKGDIIVGMSGSVGKVAIYDSNLPALQNQRIGVFKIIDADRFDKSYLKYFTFTLEKELQSYSKGVAVKNVSAEQIESVYVYAPELSEQKRIAAILDKADRLRRGRRFAQTLSDSYLQSVFIKMFGDPVANPMDWSSCQIGDVVSYSEYGTSDKSNQLKRGYPVLGMSNLTNSGELDLSSLSYVELATKEFNKLKLESGDIIFNRTNSTELVGKTASWNSPINAVLASYLVKLKLKKNTHPDYFVRLLNMPFYKRLFQERCKKAVGQSNISPTLLKEFPMIVPPLPLQEKFAAIVQKFERIRRQQREATRQAEHLFQSLLHRAFRGEL